MSSFKSVAPLELVTKPVDLFHHDWPLLCAGEEGSFNSMTIGWGSIGCVWGIPFASVFVRPTRHTYNFMEKYEYFSILIFDAPFQILPFLYQTQCLI